MVLATIVVLAIFLALGIAANAWVRPFAKTEVQGVKLELLVSPLLTLTALLLAFFLVQVFSSYQRARLSAGDEAGRVIAEYRLFGYLPDQYALRGQAALLCYARAVAELEWPALRDELKVAPEPSYWVDRLGEVLRELAEVRNGQPYGTLVATDRDRVDARRRRVLENRPALPKPLFWLMLGVSAVAVLSIATFTLPYVRRRVQIGALTLLTLVFAAVQIAILEIDGKFDGVIRLEPEEMRLAARLMEEKLHGLAPPCDAEGRPL